MSRKRSHSFLERDGGPSGISRNLVSPDEFDFPAASEMERHLALWFDLSHSVHPALQHTTEGEALVITEYTRMIHGDFAVLNPQDMDEGLARVQSSPEKLRHLFFQAADHAIRTIPGHRLPDDASNTKSRAMLAEMTQVAWSFSTERVLSTDSNKLVYAQCLILMIIASENYGPSTEEGYLGKSTRELLGQAIAILEATKLYQCEPTPEDQSAFRNLPSSSDKKCARRLYWLLYVLDILHAISYNRRPTAMGEESLLIWDVQQLGVPTFHLARKSPP
jgi:hypothetical protein